MTVGPWRLKLPTAKAKLTQHAVPLHHVSSDPEVIGQGLNVPPKCAPCLPAFTLLPFTACGAYLRCRDGKGDTDSSFCVIGPSCSS